MVVRPNYDETLPSLLKPSALVLLFLPSFKRRLSSLLTPKQLDCPFLKRSWNAPALTDNDRRITGHSMILVLVCVRRFVPPAWFAAPLKKKGTASLACRSWGCGLRDPVCSDRMNEIYARYRNNTLDRDLRDVLADIGATCVQAQCVESQMLLGIGNFSKDVNRSWLLANADGATWLCDEVAMYHPFSEMNLEKIRSCSERGSLRCMLSELKWLMRDGNYTGALELALHVASLLASEWHHKRTSGLLFAETVKSILVSNDPQGHPGWEVISDLARKWHYPSLLWLGDGVLKGLTTIVSAREVSEMLIKVIDEGPWRIDAVEVMNTRDSVDRAEVLRFYARFGDEASEAILSYPFLYE